MIRIVNIVALVIAAALVVTLYRAKTQAKNDQARLVELRAEVAAQEDAIRVLHAEIAHLEDPARLEALAQAQLGLRPIDPLRVVALDEAALLLEFEDEHAPGRRRDAYDIDHHEDGGR